MNNRQAGQAAGAPFQTLYRWQKRFEQNGMDGIAPRFTKSGRRSAAAGVRFSTKAVQALERLILETGDRQLAWQSFTKGPSCPPAVARLGLKSIPVPIERLVKLTALPARCRVSADGKRMYVNLERRGGAR